MRFDPPQFFPYREPRESISSRQTAELFLTPIDTGSSNARSSNSEQTIGVQYQPYSAHREPERQHVRNEIERAPDTRLMIPKYAPQLVDEIRQTRQLHRYPARNTQTIHELAATSPPKDCQANQLYQICETKTRGAGDSKICFKDAFETIAFCKVAHSLQRDQAIQNWRAGFTFNVSDTAFACNTCRLSMGCKTFQLRIEGVKWEVSTRFIAKCHKAVSSGSETATLGCAICLSACLNFQGRNALWAHLETHSAQEIESDSDIKLVR